MGSVVVNTEEMNCVFYNVLVKHGFSNEQAKETADIFTVNASDGILSHSVMRFERLISMVDGKVVIPNVQPKEVSGFGALLRYDGQMGNGVTNASFATRKVCALAKQYGIAGIALRNTNHWMRGGYYGYLACSMGAMLICWTNTMPNMPAWGAKNKCIGNNPFVMAVPSDDGSHFVVDTAMSQFSYGKLSEYRARGEHLPVIGGYDTSGNFTYNAADIEESGRLLPAGYWKGSSLSILLDAFVSVLSDGNSVCNIGSKDVKEEAGLSQMFIAVSPEAVGKDNAQNIIDTIKQSIRNADAATAQKVRYPGERVIVSRKKAEEYGIEIPFDVWERIKNL